MKTYEVTMARNTSMNATQNLRRRRELVKATDAEQAKAEARRKWPEFYPVSVRQL